MLVTPAQYDEKYNMCIRSLVVDYF